MFLTYPHEQKEDAEHVEDGQQRHCQRGDDLAKRWNAAKEPHDTEGAEDADDSSVLGWDEKGNEGHDDDKSINLAPHVGYKGPKPVGKTVDRELDGEYRGEEEVQIIEEAGDLGWRAVLVCEQRDKL